MSIKKEKIYTKYILTREDGCNGERDFGIVAKISSEGITLRPLDGRGDEGDREFEFEQSKPEVIDAIADLMKEAVRLQNKIALPPLPEDRTDEDELEI